MDDLDSDNFELDSEAPDWDWDENVEKNTVSVQEITFVDNVEVERHVIPPVNSPVDMFEMDSDDSDGGEGGGGPAGEGGGDPAGEGGGGPTVEGGGGPAGEGGGSPAGRRRNQSPRGKNPGRRRLLVPEDSDSDSGTV